MKVDREVMLSKRPDDSVSEQTNSSQGDKAIYKHCNGIGGGVGKQQKVM